MTHDLKRPNVCNGALFAFNMKYPNNTSVKIYKKGSNRCNRLPLTDLFFNVKPFPLYLAIILRVKTKITCNKTIKFETKV